MIRERLRCLIRAIFSPQSNFS